MLNLFIKPIINIHAIFGERCEFLRKRSFFFIKSILNEEKKNEPRNFVTILNYLALCI